MGHEGIPLPTSAGFATRDLQATRTMFSFVATLEVTCTAMFWVGGRLVLPGGAAQVHMGACVCVLSSLLGQFVVKLLGFVFICVLSGLLGWFVEDHLGFVCV